MATKENTIIKVQAEINAPLETVWNVWSAPKHIVKWNQASPEWHTSYAENDLREGGEFLSRMEARDGSTGFDFKGKYGKVEPLRHIDYLLEDNRKVQIDFTVNNGKTLVTETFEAENTHSVEMQQSGWQAILNNFKEHVESLGKTESLNFEITINATPEKVYKTMLSESTYNAWTSEFNPHSKFKGSWEKGADILFIGVDESGNEGGMVSQIKENIPNKYVSIEHLGILTDGKKITSGPEVEQWAGALENYTFKNENGKTLLVVDADSNEEYRDYFKDTWPKALKKLKEICEK